MLYHSDAGERSGTRMGRAVVLTLLLCAMFAACKKEQQQAQSKPASAPISNVVTGDIKEGIENHINEQVRLGKGSFKLPFKDKDLQLKLVRIHIEYLATLGPQSHFACVDMVGKDGEFYDVDFFMEGDPGSMKVTKTMVHKINGQPLYLWKQKEDKSWAPVPVDDASDELLGITTGKDQFEFTYLTKIPQLNGPASMWLPLPSSDDFQTIKVKAINSPVKHTILTDAIHGNKIIYLELGADDSGKNIEMIFDVDRKEKAAYKYPKVNMEEYLKSAKMVPLKANFKEAAEKAVKGKKGDLMRARALYDLVIEKMRYMKYGDGWGKGDAVYACNSLYGNCTDFHSYFVALARSVGIPARFAIGAAVPSERNEGGVDGYHCWAEFYADGKWWPVDISEADKFTSLSAYYFGHHPANRVEFSRGRDLVVNPGPSTGSINFLAYPVLEVAGKIVKVKPQFSFQRKMK
jgi:transglutaminase superfamily protein